MAFVNDITYKYGLQAKYDALLQRDEQTLYWCTDTAKLYKGDVDYTEAVRFTDDHTALLIPARGILYVEPTGAGWVFVKNAEGVDEWKQVFGKGSSSGITIVTVLDETVGDDVVPSAKAVWSLFESVDKTPIDLSEYAKTEDVEKTLESYAKKQEIKDIVDKVDYEITNKMDSMLVNYRDKEIRIMCPKDTEYSLQNVGATGDANSYYIALRAYAPFGDVAYFKEDLGKVINDETMYTFDGDFSGVDQYGRKYSIVWLAVAKYDESTDTWTYYGEKSSSERFIGWDYCVEWYNSDKVMVASDLIRINLSNEECHTSVEPYYMANYVSDADIADVTTDIEALKLATTWGEIE